MARKYSLVVVKLSKVCDSLTYLIVAAKLYRGDILGLE